MVRVGLFAIVPAIVVMLWVSGAAFASPSGLIIIPTADTVGANQYNVEFDYIGDLPDVGNDVGIVSTEFGVGDRFEGGMSVDLSGDTLATTYVDAKYVVWPGRTPVAAGFFNIGRHLSPSPYFVGTHDFGGARLHAGMMWFGGAGRLITGFDTGFQRRLAFMADYTSGPLGVWSYGVNYRVNDRLNVLLGAIHPNGKGDTMLTVQIIYGAAYRSEPDEEDDAEDDPDGEDDANGQPGQSREQEKEK